MRTTCYQKIQVVVKLIIHFSHFEIYLLLCVLADKYDVSPAQIATAWAIGRGTTPILGVGQSGTSD